MAQGSQDGPRSEWYTYVGREQAGLIRVRTCQDILTHTIELLYRGLAVIFKFEDAKKRRRASQEI